MSSAVPAAAGAVVTAGWPWPSAAATSTQQRERESECERESEYQRKRECQHGRHHKRQHERQHQHKVADYPFHATTSPQQDNVFERQQDTHQRRSDAAPSRS
jgi:hypothetical protein